MARVQRRAWFNTLLRAVATAALAGAVSALFTSNPLLISMIAAATLLFMIIAGRAGQTHRNLNQQNLARHLDRHFPELEESAALLLMPPAHATTLQGLQRKRIALRWNSLLMDQQRWLPPLRWRTPLLTLLLALVLGLAGMQFSGRGTPFDQMVTATTTPARMTGLPVPELLELTITPPAYTGLPERQQSEFDLEVAEGSLVRWSVDWPGVSQPALLINDGQAQRLAPVDKQDGRLVFEHLAQRTGLYQLSQARPDTQTGGAAPAGEPEAFHTLSVRLDAPPSLRVLEPSRSTLEIGRDELPRFSSQVRIRDDFGLTDVEIRASVAKGSGEGVKFRDEVFQFDSSMMKGDSSIYSRDWSLEQLGMEPGDEVYFFTVARDNREPEPNEARSDTVVVRWLDETGSAELAEGFAIDVLPEYFMSQRQIIIETEQLIADQDSLDQELFDATSRELAVAQAELKERYGQYLGDEFGESEGASFTVAAEAAAADANGEAAEGVHADEDEHAGEGHAGHDHGAADAQVNTQGSAAELIERFMHDHGASDIGPITRRNPVGLMKRSISNMWQSELQLHLSEPDQALPFAYEALKYLDLARQADRIYTRRLGFEPPPVTEERRLTGELDDISSRTRRQAPDPDPDPERLVKALFTQLGLLAPDQPVPPATRELLRRSAGHLTALSQQRPALIGQVVTIERMLQADRINPPGCEGCLAALRATAWSLSGTATAGPDRRAPALPAEAATGYQEALRQLRARQGSP